MTSLERFESVRSFFLSFFVSLPFWLSLLQLMVIFMVECDWFKIIVFGLVISGVL